VVECKPLVPAGMVHSVPSSYTIVQGLTLVHFSAQLEPCLTQENTLPTLNTPP